MRTITYGLSSEQLRWEVSEMTPLEDVLEKYRKMVKRPEKIRTPEQEEKEKLTMSSRKGI